MVACSHRVTVPWCWARSPAKVTWGQANAQRGGPLEASAQQPSGNGVKMPQLLGATPRKGPRVRRTRRRPEDPPHGRPPGKDAGSSHSASLRSSVATSSAGLGRRDKRLPPNRAPQHSEVTGFPQGEDHASEVRARFSQDVSGGTRGSFLELCVHALLPLSSEPAQPPPCSHPPGHSGTYRLGWSPGPW